MNIRQRARNFDATVTYTLGTFIINQKTALLIGRLTSPAFWGSYLLLAHVFWLSPGELRGDILLIIAFLPLASVLKLFFRRKRPATLYVNNMKIKSYSFPSSHAYSSALACGYFAVLLIENGAVVFAPFVLAVAVVVGFSRVVVGAHYPSDVLAGWFLGIFILACITL